MAWTGLDHSDKAQLSTKGRLLLNESITVNEAGIINFSEVRVVAKSQFLIGGMLNNKSDEDDDFKRASDESISFMQQTQSHGMK